MTLLRRPVTLAAGESVVIDATAAIRLSVIPGAGATVEYSKVDDDDATSHDADSTQSVTAETDIDVAWPFYRFSTAGGSARIGVV